MVSPRKGSNMTSDQEHRPPADKLGTRHGPGRVRSTRRPPKGVAKPRRSRWPTRHQAKLAAYLTAGHHLVYDADRKRRGLYPFRAKSLTQVAAEAGMGITSATYWLKQEHHDLWLRWWSGLGWAWDTIEAESAFKHS